MENELPPHILSEMEMMGVMPRQLPEEESVEVTVPRTFEYNMPELDENGEPPF